MQFPRDPLAPLPPQGLPDWLQPDAAPVQIVPSSPVQAPQINPVKRPGMFGNANWGSAISAALNGYLAAGGNPAGQMGLQQLHQRKMMEQRQKLAEQQYQQQRGDKREDFLFQEDYKRANPTPPGPTEAHRLAIEAGLTPGTREFQVKMAEVLDAKAAGLPVVANIGGVPSLIDRRSFGQQQTPPPPPQAVQELKANPGAAAQFDEIFGPGAAARVLGGSGGNAGGNFPGGPN